MDRATKSNNYRASRAFLWPCPHYSLNFASSSSITWKRCQAKPQLQKTLRFQQGFHIAWEEFYLFLTEVSNPSHSINLPTRIFFSHVLMWVLSIVPQGEEKQGRQLQWWCSLETMQPPHMQMKPVKPSQHLSCFLKGNFVFWAFPRSFSNALPSVLTTLKNCTNIFCGAISEHIHTRYLVP